MSIFEQLRTKWVEAGLHPMQGVSQETLDSFENNHKVTLPIAFKEYLLIANGIEDGQTDENLISFLSLEAIDQETNYKEISANEVCIVFAEYSVYSHLYVLRSSRDGNKSSVLATDGEHEIQLATSFEDFVGKYLLNPSSVAHCWT